MWRSRRYIKISMSAADSSASPGSLENPFESAHECLRKELADLQAMRSGRQEEIAWYDAFEPSGVSQRVHADVREAQDLLAEEHRLRRQTQAADAAVTAQEARASLGWNPFRYFSDEYKAEAEKLRVCLQQRNELQSKLADVERRRSRAKERAAQATRELERHRSFDILEAQAAVRAAESRIPTLAADQEKLRVLRDTFDDAIRQPLKARQHDLQREIQLGSAINRARALEERLSHPRNTRRDRAMIHDECQREFEERSPAAVIRNNERELDSVRRSLAKQDQRLAEIVRRFHLVRELKELVIDGNNLCYRNGKLIGLGPLAALLECLRSHQRFQAVPVQVVFDAHICRQLRMSPHAIEQHLGTAAHIVSAPQKADETLLVVADARGAHVISNDNFVDFADKAAVRSGRLVRHNIVGDQILVHDLDVAATFSSARG